jgi:hypothetical protein
MKKFTQVVLQCDEPTAGGNIYPREVVQEAVKQLQSRIEKRQFLGPLEGDSVRLNKASFVVTKAELKGPALTIEIEPLVQRSQGRSLALLLESGDAALYPSGMGTVKDGVVQDDYILNGFSVGWKEGPSEPSK